MHEIRGMVSFLFHYLSVCFLRLKLVLGNLYFNLFIMVYSLFLLTCLIFLMLEKERKKTVCLSL